MAIIDPLGLLKKRKYKMSQLAPAGKPAEWKPGYWQGGAKTFTVKGNPIGYYASGKIPNWTRKNQYHSYKALVQLSADAAGIPLPLQATKAEPLIIETVAYFEDGIHSDPGNIQKGIVDALFYAHKGQKRGNDKHTGGRFPPPLYDKQNPRVEVTIRRA